MRGPNVKIATETDTMVLIEAMRSNHPALRRSALHADIADILQFAFLTACRKQEFSG